MITTEQASHLRKLADNTPVSDPRKAAMNEAADKLDAWRFHQLQVAELVKQMDKWIGALEFECGEMSAERAGFRVLARKLGVEY